MKKLFALLFVLLSILSCQPSTSPIYTIQDATGHSVKIAPIYLDEKWNDVEVAAIEVAINDWNIALNGQIKLVIENNHYKIGSSDPGLMIIKVSEKDIISRQPDVIIALGWFDRSGGRRIYMVRDRPIFRGNDIETPWNMIDVSAVARHEISHSLGAPHIQHSGGLMEPGYDLEQYKCIDYTAVAAVAKYQHLSLEKMKWCKN